MKRDTKNALITGVCAGIAKEFNLNPSVVRILTVISFLVTGSLTFWLYVIAAIVMPKEE